MKQRPSWEANSSSASQTILHILWNPNVHYRIYKSPPPVPILSQINPVHASHSTSWRSILILSPHLRLGLTSGLIHPVFPTKTLYEALLSQCVLHAPPISCFLTSSQECGYWYKSYTALFRSLHTYYDNTWYGQFQ